MEQATQLSIAVENAPGQLGRLCRVLAQAGVNIRGLSVSDAIDFSTIRVLVGDPASAKRALREAGLCFAAQEVLVLELDDKPGALEDVAMRLGEGDVNVHYIYGTSGGHEGKAVLVLRVSDTTRARQILAE